MALIKHASDSSKPTAKAIRLTQALTVRSWPQAALAIAAATEDAPNGRVRPTADLSEVP